MTIFFMREMYNAAKFVLHSSFLVKYDEN